METTNAARAAILSSLLTVPHRDYNKVVPDYLTALNQDPDFVSKAMVYIFQTSQIRDLVDAAVITLLKSNPDFGLRPAGKALFGLEFYITGNTDGLKALPPFRLFRIYKYLISTKPTVFRVARTLVGDYFDFLMKDPNRFDQVIALNRVAVKHAARTSHLNLPPTWKRAIFDNDPDPNSLLGRIKKIATTSDMTERARMVVEYNIPFRVAASLLPKNNPTALVARVASMSPTEAANSLAELEASGILNIPDVKAAVLRKVEKASTSAASLQNRRSTIASKDEDIRAAISTATNAAIKKQEPLTGRYLLLVDKSQSLGVAIETAISLVSYLGPRIADPKNLMIVTQDDEARVIKPRDLTFEGVSSAMRLIRAGGWTSLGVGLAKAIQLGFEPTHIVHITDGGENRVPYYGQTMLFHKLEHVTTTVIGVHGARGYKPAWASELRNRGLRVEEFTLTPNQTQDYYAFDQVAAILAGKGKKSLVETILDLEMPYVRA